MLLPAAERDWKTSRLRRRSRIAGVKQDGVVVAPSIEVVEGDITEQRVDGVVNAANSSLLGGGGVDGAIHRRGGPDILAACRVLRAGHYGRGLKVGQAVATTAGRLPARWVVHTVGPVWSDEEDRSSLLAACHYNAMGVAAELGAESVAFPAISTGIYRWPLSSAAEIAVSTVSAMLAQEAGSVKMVRFVLRGQDAFRLFRARADELGLTTG
jgi:O-acetyl-ADP-ribose deacetylase (regulator of RNase III)